MKKLEKYDELVHQMLIDWKVPGSAVAIIQNSEVIHMRGYGLGDLENEITVDPGTIFAIGSTSKAFTGVTAGILVDRGILEWDVPVKTYLPDFELWDPFATERMTVRDLLSHRSGLPRHDGLWYGTPFSRKELVQRLKYLQPSADFRTTFQYQNLMFMAAGYLVEAVSGKTWEEFTRENILEPLQMTRTSLSVDGLQHNTNTAKGYAPAEKGHKLLEYRDLNAISPAGGINSCLEDLVKWLSIHLQGGKYQNKRVISADSLRQTHTPVTIINTAFSRVLQNFSEVGPESYALGWFVHDYRGQKLIRHGGHIDGFSTQISFMPGIDAGVIVLSNIGGSSWMFAPTFAAYDLLLDLPVLDWSGRIKGEEERGRKANEDLSAWFVEKQVKKTKPSSPLAEYAGSYMHPGYGRLVIEHEKGQISATFNGRKSELSHYHHDVFDWPLGRANAAPLKVSFESDLLGRVQRVFVPLEVNVEPVCFSRLPAAGLQDRSYLEAFTGLYTWDEKEVMVSLGEKDTLRVHMPGYPLLKLEPYREAMFKVQEQPNWFVEFKGNPVNEFQLVQTSSLITIKKMDDDAKNRL